MAESLSDLKDRLSEAINSVREILTEIESNKVIVDEDWADLQRRIRDARDISDQMQDRRKSIDNRREEGQEFINIK